LVHQITARDGLSTSEFVDKVRASTAVTVSVVPLRVTTTGPSSCTFTPPICS
jgi:hypothetical protein